MSFSVVSCRSYPLRRAYAKCFSQELIKYVLLEFGEPWKYELSETERRLRKGGTFIFTPDIGRLVAHISLKYGAFIVRNCLSTWKYVFSHRPCIRERLLSNAIGTLCKQSDFETDDLAIVTFMAMAVELARLAKTRKEDSMIDVIINSLSRCLTDGIPGGFIEIVNRLEIFVSTFEHPRKHIYDYGPGRQFEFPTLGKFQLTSSDELVPQLMPVSAVSSDALFNVSMEEVEVEYRKRELRRELFRRAMLKEVATQTKWKNEDSETGLESLIKSEDSEFVLKMDVKRYENGNRAILEGEHHLIKTRDVCIQTGKFLEKFNVGCMEQDKMHGECITGQKNGHGAVDSNIAVENSNISNGVQSDDKLTRISKENGNSTDKNDLQEETDLSSKPGISSQSTFPEVMNSESESPNIECRIRMEKLKIHK